MAVHSAQRLLCAAFAVLALSAVVAIAEPGTTNAVAAVANDGTAAVANVPGQVDQDAVETVQHPVTFTTKSFANADTTIFEATDEWQEVGDNEQLTPGLDIKMDLAAGKKWARKMQPVPGQPPRRKFKTNPIHDEPAPAPAVVQSPPVDAAATDSGATALGGGAGDDADGSQSQGMTVKEANKLETAKRILAGLPQPEPELVDALRKGPALSRAEMAKLLDRLWQKRQAELRDVMASVQTEAAMMQGLLARSMQASAHLSGQPLPLSPDDEVLGVKPPLGADATELGDWYHADLLQALEDLEFHVTDVDNAVDFSTMGGVDIMGKLLQTHDHAAIRRLAAWVVGNAVKYNADVQRRAVESGLLAQLMTHLNQTLAGHLDDGHSHAAAADVAAKVVYAISTLVRGSPFAQHQFAVLDGHRTLVQALYHPRVAREHGRDAGVVAKWQAVAAKAAALASDISVELRHRNSPPGRAAGGDAGVKTSGLADTTQEVAGVKITGLPETTVETAGVKITGLPETTGEIAGVKITGLPETTGEIAGVKITELEYETGEAKEAGAVGGASAEHSSTSSTLDASVRDEVHAAVHHPDVCTAAAHALHDAHELATQTRSQGSASGRAVRARDQLARAVAALAQDVACADALARDESVSTVLDRVVGTWPAPAGAQGGDAQDGARALLDAAVRRLQAAS